MQEAKGAGRVTSALPDEGLMVCLGLRFNLNFCLKVFTLPYLYGFFPPKVATARYVEICVYDQWIVELRNP